MNSMFAPEGREEAEPLGQYRMVIAAAPHAVRHVRRGARGQARWWGMPQVAEAAELAVSEVLTNVVRHAGVTVCAVSFLRYPEGMRVEVRDGCPGLPVPRRGDGLAEGGRGLALLAAVTDAWDAEPA